MKNPEQDLFDLLMIISKQLGYVTYDFRPAKDVGYPFVEVGNVNLTPDTTKSVYLANLSIEVHVWGTQKQRTTVSKMMNAIFRQASILKNTNDHNFRINANSSTTQLIGDTSTDSFLWHGVIDLDIKLI